MSDLLPKPASGIFLSHIDTVRVRRHFDRLVHETEGLVDWHFVLNFGRQPDPVWNVASETAERVLPTRYAEMRSKGGVQRGYVDTIVIPCVLALHRPFVWAMEYDVDFSGNWHDFFCQFDDDESDLLTTTIMPKELSESWHWWKTARAPNHVPTQLWFRAFHPIMRISQKMATAYRSAVEHTGWSGHYEFSLPTVAMTTDCSLKDLKEKRKLASGSRQNYINNPDNYRLTPGTFVWRPSRKSYFHEEPQDIFEADMLYHPVKTDVDDWEKS